MHTRDVKHRTGTTKVALLTRLIAVSPEDRFEYRTALMMTKERDLEAAGNVLRWLEYVLKIVVESNREATGYGGGCLRQTFSQLQRSSTRSREELVCCRW